MKVNICKKAIPLLAALVLSACATGQSQYDVAMQLDQSGKYNDAISYLEDALQQEPGNTKYQQALAEIKEKLINEYLQAGQKALASSLSLTSINKAKEQLAMAREIAPSNSKVSAFASEVKEQEDKLLASSSDLYDAAILHADSGEWTKAYFNLQQLQSRFPGYKDSFQLMTKVSKQGSETYFQEAQSLFEKDQFEKAADLLQKVFIFNPDHALARKMLTQARSNNNKEYFIDKAFQSIQEKKWDQGITAYERALAFDPADDTLKDLIRQVKGRAVGHSVQTARQQMGGNRLFLAFETFALAKKFSAKRDRNKLNKLRQDLTKKAELQAKGFADKQRYGSAWFWYKQIKAIEPGYPQIFHKIQGVEDEIKESVRKSIAIFDFHSPSSHQDAGIIVANNLITYLFKNASGDIKILERENLKSILEEMKLGQIGVVSSASAQEMGQVYGIDQAIMGSVLIYTVDSSQSEGTKTVRYQIGMKIEDNIDYLNWKARHPSPTLEALKEAPLAKVKTPEYTEKEYKVSQHKKIGLIQISFRIVDVATGENIQVKTLEKKEVVMDDTCAGLKEAGITFDPLDMPTDTELLQKITNEVVAELGRETLRPMENLEQRYFQEGEKHLRRRDNSAAAESFVQAIFDERMKRIQESPLSRKAMEYLREIFREQ